MKIYKMLMAAAVFVAFAGSANAQRKNADLIGTWKLESFTTRHENGTVTQTYGENPSGYVGYAPDGRMYAFVVRGDRKKAGTGPTKEAEDAKLLRGMTAYSGSYTRENSTKVILNLDISADEVLTGMSVARYILIEGDTLTLSPDDPTVKKETRTVSTWKRIRGEASR